MKKLVTKKLTEEIRRCFQDERIHRASASIRCLDSKRTDARVVTAFFLNYVLARRKNRLDDLKWMSFETALDEFASDCPALNPVLKRRLEEAFWRAELKGTMLSYLDIDEGTPDEVIGFDACRSFFDERRYFCHGTNYIPNLGDIVSNWRDGDAPVLLLMSEMGFLPYWLADCGIDCIIRCSSPADVELANLLGEFVGRRIRAEYVAYDDMYKTYPEPVSSVICLFNPELILENTDKRAKRPWLDVLERLRRWHSGKVIFFTTQDRILEKRLPDEELNARKKMVESGWARKIALLPFKNPFDGGEQPVMLYIDFAAKRFTGLQMVNLSDDRFTEKVGPYCFLKTEVVKPLLFTHKGSGDPSHVDFSRLLERPIALELTDALSGVPEYADYTCICSLDEMRENGFSLDVLRYLIGSRNRMWFQLASGSRIVLPDIADLIAFQDLPLASADEDGIDCLMVEPEDLEIGGGVRQPTRQVRVTREGFAQYRVQQYDILLVRHGSKEQLGKIAFLAEKVPDNWVASSSLMIIRKKTTERVGDWQEKPWYWSQEQVYRYLTSDAVTAYLKSKMWNPHASAFPTRYLESLPMVMADDYAVAAEIFRFRQRMEIRLENRRDSTPDPNMTQNQVKRLI